MVLGNHKNNISSHLYFVSLGLNICVHACVHARIRLLSGYCLLINTEWVLNVKAKAQESITCGCVYTLVSSSWAAPHNSKGPTFKSGSAGAHIRNVNKAIFKEILHQKHMLSNQHLSVCWLVRCYFQTTNVPKYGWSQLPLPCDRTPITCIIEE